MAAEPAARRPLRQRPRVFLAGDAVHLVIPTGGLGMNTGVGDAIDLSWKLAATLRAGAGPNCSNPMRSSAARSATATSARRATPRRAAQMASQCGARTSATIRRKAPRPARNLARVADIEQRKTNEMIGAELGYRYTDSPIICNVPGGPEHLFRDYQPTTWPGARLPHLWLADGTPIQDRIPDGYTILKLGKYQGRTADLERAIHSHGAPSSMLDVPDAAARDIYGHDLILLRPDMHVVWRGQDRSADSAKVAAIATGHSP